MTKFRMGVFATIGISVSLLFAIEVSTLVKVGQIAPDFWLENTHGSVVKLSDYVGHNPVVLIFYPGDETPGCTKQLCMIRDDFAKFDAKHVKVFGINPGDSTSHQKFINHYGFQFQLLIDKGQNVAKKYGCDARPMVKRTVVAIDKSGTILYVKQGMPSNEEILAAIPDPDEKM
jgi:peroxiredoxin Q/BCP